MSRPAAWNMSSIATVWLDVETGLGVDDQGRAVRPLLGGRRSKPALVDLLNTAAQHGATRVMLSGKFPTVSAQRAHWLLVATEGWVGGGHYIKDDRPPTGRFLRLSDQSRVEVRVAREWFGTDDISSASAREAMILTEQVLSKALPGRVGASPSATGQNVWAHSLPKDLDPVSPSAEVAELIHATSGQHRTEHFVEGRSRCGCGDCPPLIAAGAKVDGFCYVDGRFMYAGLCREVGVGGTMLTAGEAEDWLAKDRYARGRFRIRFSVPEGWDSLGLLGVYKPDDGLWHYPNRPGSTHETWVDAFELSVVQTFWAKGRLEVLEGIGFEKARPLDNFANRLLNARKAAAALDADQHLIDAVQSALRSVLLQTIGGFHSQGRDRTMTVSSTLDVPPDYQSSIRSFGDLVTYMIPAEVTTRMAQFHHPEYSSQVWARERARILQGPTAAYTDDLGTWDRWGALDVDPATLIGINGDAIYLTTVPQACLPSARGGGDDGGVGKLRVKGWIGGPMTAPPTTDSRNTLRVRAEAVGPPLPVEDLA